MPLAGASAKWWGALLGALIVPLAWLLTSWGKIWRRAHGLQFSGWIIGIATFGLMIAAQTATDAKTARNLTAEFAATGERRVAQVRAALQRGDYETAKAVLQPIAAVPNDTVKALNFAAEALESSDGDTTKAAHALSEKAKDSKEDGAAYVAAIADLSPQAAAHHAEATQREVAEAQRQAREKAQEAQAQAREEAERAPYSRFFSSWDGAHAGIVAQVKAQMHDPTSFKHVSTDWQEGAESNLVVIMTYRGTNAFGGVITQRVGGVISGQDGRVLALTAME